MPIQHSFVSAKSDSADATLVRPSDWNAAHIGGVEAFNVKVDYGATGDGVADDTAEIQAAIDAAAVNGGTVFLPPGAYKISATLNLAIGVKVIGSGRGAAGGDGTSIQPSAETFAAFTATGLIVRWSVSDLNVDYSVATTSTPATNAAAIAFNMLASGTDYPFFFELERIDVYYAYRAFSSVTTCRAFMFGIRHFYASQIGEYGIVIKPTSGCTTVVLQNVFVNVAVNGGFDLSGIDSLSIISCAVDNCDPVSGNINSFSACRGTIMGFQAESSTIPASGALMLVSNCIMTILGPKFVGNVYATGGAGECYGIRISSFAQVDIFSPLNSSETSTGTGSSFVISASSDSYRCFVHGGNGIAAPSGTASDNGIYLANGKIAHDNLGPFAQIGGTVSLPAYSFALDPDSGVYRIGADNIGIAANGVKQVDIGTASTTFAGTAVTAATAAGAAGLRLPHGTAPSSPVDGDLWTTTAGLYARINAGTVGPYGSAGAASDTVAGVIEIAVQSEQETGTDVVRAVTPGRQHFHPSAAKCWVASTQSSTTIQLSYNVTSVADTGTGISTVTIATDFSGTTYVPIVGAEHNSASGTTQTYNIDDSGRAAGTYIIQSWQVDGTEALTDPSASWFSVCFGDQA